MVIMPAVRYFVTDVQRSIKFYESLGFNVLTQYGPPFAIVQRNGLELWLSGKGTSAAKEMPDGRVPEPGGWNRIVIETDALTTLYDALKVIGTVFRNEPITGPGGTQVLIDDPDGNPVELFEPRS